MHYCTTTTPEYSPPISFTMNNINGINSSEPVSDFTIHCPPIHNYVFDDDFPLLHTPRNHEKPIIETSLPYCVPRTPEYFNRTARPAVPSILLESNFPVLDLLSRAPGSCWSNLALGDNYMREYLPAMESPLSYHSRRSQPYGSGTRDRERRATKSTNPKAPRLEFKKFRSNPQASCPPLKVRKEKLGDRIAALQQLVAPYGKTDTASVLSEAIGYIKFLHDQVEALSQPYVRLSRVGTRSEKLEGGSREDNHGSMEVEPKGELRKHGLCLVPQSCLTHVDFSNFCGPIVNWPFPRVL